MFSTFAIASLCLAGVSGRTLAAPSAAVGWRQTQPLCAFRTEADLAKWRLRRSTPASEFRLGQDATGTPAAVLRYPAYTGKGEKWPAIAMAAKAMAVRNWSHFRYLRFHLTSPLAEKLPLRLYLRNAEGAIGKFDIRLPQAVTSAPIEIDLDGVLSKRSDMAQLHFFMSTPPLDCPFTLRDLELVTEDAGLVAARHRDALLQHRELLADLGAPADAARTLCNALIDKLRAALSQLREKPADAAGVHVLETAAEAEAWLTSEDQLELVRQAPYLKVAQQAPSGASFGYGIESSMTKVLWQDVPFVGRLQGEARLALAGDEEESIQVVILTLREVRALRASLHWETPDCPLEAELGWMGHVQTKQPPYSVDYVGWWPDPILTFLESVDLPPRRAEALWVTVRAPRGTPAGTQRARVHLAAADGAQVDVPLEVEVFGFDLPQKRHLPLALSWGEMLPTVYGLPASKGKAYAAAIKAGTPPEQVEDSEVSRLLRIRRDTANFLLRKRAEPDMIYRASPPNLDEVERWISRGMTRFNVLKITGNRQRNAGILAEVMPEIEKRGLLPYAYVYGYDEVKPDKFPQMRAAFADVKARWPKLQTMTTAYDHSFGLDTDLTGVIDIWVPLTPKFVANLDRVAEARALGTQVWWYTCCGPRHPYSNWFIEYPAIEARLLMGEQAFFAGTQGYLYYQLSRWVHQQYSDPIRKPITDGPLTDWDPRSYRTFNGDGSVFCPGPEGPLSTIRLENIRDGLEDYEYLWMLRRASDLVQQGAAQAPSHGWVRAAQTALTSHAPLKTMMTTVGPDPRQLTARRDTIARLLARWAKTNAQRTPPED